MLNNKNGFFNVVKNTPYNVPKTSTNKGNKGHRGHK